MMTLKPVSRQPPAGGWTQPVGFGEGSIVEVSVGEGLGLGVWVSVGLGEVVGNHTLSQILSDKMRATASLIRDIGMYPLDAAS